MILCLEPNQPFDLQKQQALAFFDRHGFLELIGKRGSGKTMVLSALAERYIQNSRRVGVCCFRSMHNHYERLAYQISPNAPRFLYTYALGEAQQRGGHPLLEKARRDRVHLLIVDEAKVIYGRHVQFPFLIACAYTPDEPLPPPNSMRERVMRMASCVDSIVSAV